ncbi:MAG: type IV toxin-antitoxin system AbiEi family antitoxin [Candidatus Omnitrophica bacterium]|nr:type IV toxin-antitoxin system AbiEi family antitoxin [Candidatus Omnitrophota bacterium]
MKILLGDKANIIIRAMLSQPDRKWVARDFEKEFGVGRARAAKVLSELRAKGFVGGVRSGRLAHSILQNKEELLEEWLKVYKFELNEAHLYYSTREDILPRLKEYFAGKKEPNQYALTLHTGANLITSYVNTQTIYCYLPVADFKRASLDLRQVLDLKELKTGGNFYLINPYYRSATFFNTQVIKGYNVVSNLQLYLDLYHFPQRGRDHAEYLLKTLKEEGKPIA